MREIEKVQVPLGVTELPKWAKELMQAGLETFWYEEIPGYGWLTFVPTTDKESGILFGQEVFSVYFNSDTGWYTLGVLNRHYQTDEAEKVVAAIKVVCEIGLDRPLSENAKGIALAFGITVDEVRKRLGERTEALYESLTDLVDEVGAPKKKPRRRSVAY